MTATDKLATGAPVNVPTAGQKRVVIVGASGMVGGYALRYALDNAAIERLTSIGRKKLGISHPKLKEVVHQNFADCSSLANVLLDQDAAVYCLGTYTDSVSDAELRTVTAGYTMEFARVLCNSSPNASFSFLSGNGADPTGRSRLAFARYKGEAERALLAAGFPHVYLFRPAYIYPVQPRKEPNFTYRLIRAVYPVFRLLFPNQVVRADDLAWAMVDVVLRETQEHRTADSRKPGHPSHGQVANTPTRSRRVNEEMNVLVHGKSLLLLFRNSHTFACAGRQTSPNTD
jgi:uncharacterized protein YbjT (DUF2867 family)